MSDFINQVSQQAEQCSASIGKFYSENVKSKNPSIQKAIDWAPSIIMAIGIQLAPAVAVTLAASTLLIHLKNPKVISSNLMKSVLTGFALNFAANSLLPVAKAAMYISLALTICVSAKYFDELKVISNFLLEKQYESALNYSKDILVGKKNEMVGHALNLIENYK